MSAVPLATASLAAQEVPLEEAAAPVESTAAPDRPGTASWLSEIEVSARRAQETARPSPPTVESGIDSGTVLFLVCIAASMAAVAWFVVSAVRTPPQRPAEPGAGTRFVVVPDDRRRYSPAGTSIIARTTGFIRKGTAALRRKADR